MSTHENNSIGDFLDRDYKWLFEKCLFDLTQATSSNSNPQYDYCILNLALGLNHLFDWFLNGENQFKIECIKIFNPYKNINHTGKFKELYEGVKPFPEVNENQRNVRLFSNAQKHFILEHKPDGFEIEEDRQILSVAGSVFMYAGNPKACAGYFERNETLIKTKNKKHVAVDVVCCQLFKEWKEFIDKAEN
jgi:hypothetical protein